MSAHRGRVDPADMSKLPMPSELGDAVGEGEASGHLMNDRLAQLALDRGFVVPEELDRARAALRSGAMSLARAMIDTGCVTPRQADRLLADVDAERTSQRLPGFSLLGKIGSGSSATVLKARQLNLDRLVAIKVLPKGSAKDPALVERFKAEARRAAKLNHPNIVQVFDVDQAGEALYIVMEYVPGLTVHDLVRERGKLDEVEALDITIAMADALAHAHARGLVHRDVKPKNIILTHAGVPKLADLGLAREIADREAGLAERGHAFGTPYYISPEQVRGDVDIGPPADIYSLGATFYLMLTGQVPFKGERAREVMDRHLHDPLVPPRQLVPEITDGVNDLVAHMMQKQVERRFSDCDELLIELRAWKAYHTLRAGEQAAPARRA